MTEPVQCGASHARGRLLALYSLSLGVLMIALNTTIVTVALPSVATDLRFSETSLTWLVNAYTLSFGGSLLLSGRMGDLYGRRRVFLAGIGLFTLASIICGVASVQTLLLFGRAVQGIGSAIVASVSLSLIMNLFPEPSGRAKAVGIYGFVCAAGGGLGELLGGVLVQMLGWHWIFLVNLPIGSVVFACCILFLPSNDIAQHRRRLDIAGAGTLTTALTLLAFCLVSDPGARWGSTERMGLFGVVGALLLSFVVIENLVVEPLIPRRLLKPRDFAKANVLSALWGASNLGWFVIGALYLQRILRYDPLQVGLAFVPAEAIMALFSVGLSAKMVMCFGTRRSLSSGLVLAAAGLGLLARAPAGGTFLMDVLPCMLLLGLGSGMVASPLLLAALSDVDKEDWGVASGIINTSSMLGGALGLAALSRLGEVHSDGLRKSGAEVIAALNGGYHLSFLVSALFTSAAAVLSACALQGEHLRSRSSESVP